MLGVGVDEEPPLLSPPVIAGPLFDPERFATPTPRKRYGTDTPAGPIRRTGRIRQEAKVYSPMEGW